MSWTIKHRVLSHCLSQVSSIGLHIWERRKKFFHQYASKREPSSYFKLIFFSKVKYITSKIHCLHSSMQKWIKIQNTSSNDTLLDGPSFYCTSCKCNGYLMIKGESHCYHLLSFSNKHFLLQKWKKGSSYGAKLLSMDMEWNKSRSISWILLQKTGWSFL